MEAGTNEVLGWNQELTVLSEPHELSQSGMNVDQAAAEADQRSSNADLVSSDADIAADGRDLVAANREMASEARDTAAAARDRAAVELEPPWEPFGPALRATIRRAADVRTHAAADRELAAADREAAAEGRSEAILDRERAAADRKHAAMDREHAAMDRKKALDELERAHTDDLTGAYRRGAGQIVLQAELDRATRSGEGLVLAFVDVDGLKATNDSSGHAAGDTRLRDVVRAMRSKIRTYEPIVRYGGDEFLCSFAGVSAPDVEVRFKEIVSMLDHVDDGDAVSVGLAEMGDGDSLQDLINRADLSLIEKRRLRRD